MKLVFISDIHGSLKYTKQAIDIFMKEQGTYLVILGDVLYHGPRNPLPDEYNPKEVADLLNKYSKKIIAVRGNCDSEVDQMLLQFPCMGDYSTILWNDRRLFLTHGHIFNENNMPNLEVGDVIVHGHTHILTEEIVQGIHIINPGSISYPKENNPHSYGILEENTFYIKKLDGTVIKNISLD